jgi:hypothetical protein
MVNYIILEIDEENDDVYPIQMISAETEEEEEEVIEKMETDIKEEERNVYWELYKLEKVTSRKRDDVNK